MKISRTPRIALTIAAFWTAGASAEGLEWEVEVGSSLESGETTMVETANASVTPTFHWGDDWSMAPTLAWSVSRSSPTDTLVHSLVPSISVEWSRTDLLQFSANGWASALEDPVDGGGSLGLSTGATLMEWLTLDGGLTGGWSQSAQWFGTLSGGARAGKGMVRAGLSSDLTYATVPVSTGKMQSKSLYTFQTSVSSYVDVHVGSFILGPNLSWTGYSYDKKPGKKAAMDTAGMAKPQLSGSHSEWNAGAHLFWKATEWLSVNAWGGRRWTDDQSSLDDLTRTKKKNQEVSRSVFSTPDPTIDQGGLSLEASW